MDISLKSVVALITFCVFSFQTNAQKSNQTNTEEQVSSITKTKNKGKLYLYWGWNKAQYSRSDITFKGDNYNFTLYDVGANDRQTKWDSNKYLNPTNMTLPQTNFRIGYYFHDNWNLSLGIDHMKYIMNQYKTVRINGYIDQSETDTGTTLFNGAYNGDDTIFLYEEFLEFEHTDGLNYVNIEIARVDNIGDYFNWNSDKIQVNLTESFGAGFLYPKTNTKLLGKDRYDQFNVAGYGMGIKAGLNLTFFKYFFVQGEFKTGYIDMNNIRTTKSKSDSAKQSFFFFQRNITFGLIFQLFK